MKFMKSYYLKIILEIQLGTFYIQKVRNKINHVYHLSILEDYLNIDLSKINYVFEFGGGYGCMARIFLKLTKI